MKPEPSAAKYTPLGDRLRRITQLTLSIVLTLVAVIVIVSSSAVNLHALIGGSQAKAKVLAENAGATLMFQDERAAQELLKSLQNSPDVHAAAIYDKDWKLFSRYRVAGHNVPASLDAPRPSYRPMASTTSSWSSLSFTTAKHWGRYFCWSIWRPCMNRWGDRP